MANMISAVSSMLIISFHLVLLLPSIDNAEARPLLTDAGNILMQQHNFFTFFFFHDAL